MTLFPSGISEVKKTSGMCQVAHTRPVRSRARLRPSGNSLGSR